MTLEGKEIDIKPGSIHFNPMNKVHSLINTGSGDLVVFQGFAPAWEEPDRVLVP